MVQPNGSSNSRSHSQADADDVLSFDYAAGREKFSDKMQERQYIKERLALAFRILSAQGIGSCSHARLC